MALHLKLDALSPPPVVFERRGKTHKMVGSVPVAEMLRIAQLRQASIGADESGDQLEAARTTDELRKAVVALCTPKTGLEDLNEPEVYALLAALVSNGQNSEWFAGALQKAVSQADDGGVPLGRRQAVKTQGGSAPPSRSRSSRSAD